ncbi:MAG: DUF2500 family protein, partial [Candidatus Moranbacteria bacterium]|nr:DUF2500 family protein [Candidatus Moranbacteria bacterium]
MLLILLVAVVLIGSLVAVGFAIVKVQKNIKEQNDSPEIRTNAKAIRTYSNSQESYTVDSANSHTTSTYHIEFLLGDNSKKTFKVNKKLFLSTNDNDNGILIFKGNKIIEFQKDIKSNLTDTNQTKNKGSFFFQNAQKNGMTVKFYADAPSINITIPSNAPIECDYDEVCKYVDQMPIKMTDNFFSLEKSNGEVIEFSNDGKSSIIEIEIPLD